MYGGDRNKHTKKKNVSKQNQQEEGKEEGEGN